MNTSVPSINYTPTCGEGSMAGHIDAMLSPLMGQFLGVALTLAPYIMVASFLVLLVALNNYKRGKVIVVIAWVALAVMLISGASWIVPMFAKGC